MIEIQVIRNTLSDLLASNPNSFKSIQLCLKSLCSPDLLIPTPFKNQPTFSTKPLTYTSSKKPLEICIASQKLGHSSFFPNGRKPVPLSLLKIANDHDILGTACSPPAPLRKRVTSVKRRAPKPDIRR